MQLQYLPEDVCFILVAMPRKLIMSRRGIFHLRLRSAPDDFLLLSPLEPEAEDSSLTRYLTALKRSSWWFCKICGVRCFTVRHPAENTEAEVPVESLQKLGIKEKSDAEGPDDVVKVPVYKLKSEGFAESPHGTSYFSLNAVTLDAHQEGLNLAQWHENRWVQYVDSLGDGRGWKTGEPHPGGIY